jgi:hypothetical protein
MAAKQERAHAAMNKTNNIEVAKQEALRIKRAEKEARTQAVMEAKRQEQVEQVVAKREEFDRKCRRASVDENTYASPSRPLHPSRAPCCSMANTRCAPASPHLSLHSGLCSGRKPCRLPCAAGVMHLWQP